MFGGVIMKKYIVIFAFVVLIISTVACSSDVANEHLKVGFALGISGIDDRSYNQHIWEGIEKYATDNGMPKSNYSYENSASDKDYIINLSNYSDQKLDLIVAAGYYYKEPMLIVSEKYPSQKYVLIDAITDGDNDNIMSITFAENEGSFLAGVVAALKADSMNWDKVGFLGGIDIDSVQRFEAGFIEGVHFINPNIDVEVRFVESFSNPIKGQRFASQMYSEGFHIIYNVAGATGNGIIKECVRRAEKGEDVWVIGVDRDQYEDGIYGDNKSCVLTSMLKKVDNVVYDIIGLVEDDKFKGGHSVYGLREDGVGLPDENPNLEDDWIKTVKIYKQRIINGTMKIPEVPIRLK